MKYSECEYDFPSLQRNIYIAGDFTSLLTITSANLKHMRRVVASKLMESKGKYMKHDYYILALVPIIEL